jgi:hypothetical protein
VCLWKGGQTESRRLLVVDDPIRSPEDLRSGSCFNTPDDARSRASPAIGGRPPKRDSLNPPVRPFPHPLAVVVSLAAKAPCGAGSYPRRKIVHG